MKYSFIIPVYNRPDEVDELLQSMTHQTLTDFEVIVVEDGSARDCKEVCARYAGKLDLHYYMKENSGPGQSRNYGAERARGEYLIILDSDVVLPEGYHLLLHDVILHHRRHTRRQEEDGQVLSPLVQHGHTPRRI